MAKITTLLSSCALAVAVVGNLVSTSYAQTANEPALTIDGLSSGTAVTETRAPGDTYFNGEFNDWSMRCIVVADGQDPCQMYQLMADQQGSPIAEFTMFRLPEAARAAAGATIVVPLETSLSEGLVIKVDDQEARSYPFAFCNNIGCYARIGLTEEEVNTYRNGAQAILSIVPVAAPDQRVTVTLSLSGFTAAFNAASELDP
ncbi:MAG: invasion associated locus B family protein [Paracoccaceae bacterium]